jgi:hypothetical protein
VAVGTGELVFALFNLARPKEFTELKCMRYFF